MVDGGWLGGNQQRASSSLAAREHAPEATYLLSMAALQYTCAASQAKSMGAFWQLCVGRYSGAVDK